MKIPSFHAVHGSGIEVSENSMVATRSGDFCNGVTFTASPIKVGQKVCLEVTHTTEWSGAIRIGVTSRDPASHSPRTLPRYVCPDLTNKDGYWARALNENYAETGSRVTFYTNTIGQLHYFVNKEHKGILLSHLPTNKNLWAMFDIYGNTVSAKFVPAEEAPTEILARGPDAMKAYHKACECGTQPVFRTRLMLVGQDRVGKTSLKKSLVGQKHNQSELSTDGIDLSSSCSFNMRDRTAWKLAISGGKGPGSGEREGGGTGSGEGGGAGENSTEPTARHRKESESLGTESLEEEYFRAIATNIVQELIYRQKEHEKLEVEGAEDREDEGTRVTSAGSRRVTSSEARRNYKEKRRKETLSSKSRESTLSVLSTDTLRGHELLAEMPERVVLLVDEMLKEREKSVYEGRYSSPQSASSMHSMHSSTNTTPSSGRNIVLNIWDFAGQAAYYTTHQVFLSSRAVYVIVFNLCHDMSNCSRPQRPPSYQRDPIAAELSSFDYMDYWMNSIHAHTAKNTRDSVDNTTLSPPVFIVGTHRGSLHDAPELQAKLVEDKFDQIRLMVENKPYSRHIVPHYYAVENSLENSQDEEIEKLQRHIEEIASRESYMGEQMPIKWLKFEKSVNQLVEDGARFTSLEQIREVAKEEGIYTNDEFRTMLQFYHDLGVIIYYGGLSALDNTLRNTVILKPQWLVDMFKRIITVRDLEQQWGAHRDLWARLETTGVLEEKLIDHVWRDHIDQKAMLLGLMDKFDLICERLPPHNVNLRVTDRLGLSYYVPSRLRRIPDSQKLYAPTDHDVTFYLDFSGFLPDGLFHRILTRAIRWSQECGGHEPQLFYRKSKFYLDNEHDYVLEMAPLHFARISVTVLRMVDLDDSDESSEENEDKVIPPPKPAACAKIRNFLETTLSELREMWMKRITYKGTVACPCDQPCAEHERKNCADNQCLHFLLLDECLANKVVLCEHRRIKTTQFRKWFPSPIPVVKRGPILPDSVAKEDPETLFGNIEVWKGAEMPSWVKSAAKLLNGGSEGQDWTALAKRLGYKKMKIDKLNEDLNPALALITDWIITAGNTALSVDMLQSCLEQMSRDDIVEIIQKGQESEADPAHVFISYQWDAQDEVNSLRDKLEKTGFSCWMDIGQMGGGDQLYVKIDEAIRNCKVVIACVTPKYVVSHYCNRELALADLLRKPIIPVMYDKVPWPPPGGMSLMFSQLVYINMKGVGGHGGSGIHADTESKYQEIIQRTSIYAKREPRHTVELTPRSDIEIKPFSFGSTTEDRIIEISTPSPARNPLILPGYGALTMEGMRRIGTSRGQLSNQSDISRSASQQEMRNSAASPSREPGERSPNRQGQPVEQVHVTKCAVCVIL